MRLRWLIYLDSDPETLSNMTTTPEQDADGVEIDPIWTTSRTARQIYSLGEVEKVRDSFGQQAYS